MDVPKRIWVDLLTVDFASNPYDKPAENGPRKCEAEYILATEHDRIVAEKDAEIARLQEALDAIWQYGDDTLSGPTGLPDDRKWQRDGVLEMTRRARAALKGGSHD